MRLRDLLRRRPALRSDDLLAVPLTPVEAGQLVQALRENDRLTHVHRPDISGGSGHSRSEAESIARMAGIAAALGHPYVPHPVQSLHMHNYVLTSLQRWAPRAASTAAFAELLTRMHILAGMAGVHRWSVRYDQAVGGMRWTTPPTGVPGEAAPRTPTPDAATTATPAIGSPGWPQ